VRISLGGAIASALFIASASVSAQSSDASRGPWHNTVESTDRAHVIGNPDADTTLIEFVSYTCSHCANFAIQGDPALELAFVSPGHTRVEIRSVIRNALDLTATLLVGCGVDSKFKGNHAAVLRSQKDWLPIAINAPQAQQQIWARADTAARLNMANALGFITKFENRGYSRSELTTCLSDNTEARRLLDNGAADAGEFPIAGTPSFALDGELLVDIHDWSALYPVLSGKVKDKQRAKAETAGSGV